MPTTPKPRIEVDSDANYIRIDTPGASYAIQINDDVLSVRAREGVLAVMPMVSNLVYLAEVRDRDVRKALGL